MIEGVRFDRARLAEAASDELIAATDVADLLVRLGMPFREAHGVVAALVRNALDSGRALSQMTPEDLAAVSELLAAHEDQLREILREGSWLESKVSEGGTAGARLREQLHSARAELDAGASG